MKERKKISKKIITILTLAVMLLNTMVLPVSATSVANVNLPDPTMKGSITIHKYLMDDVSKATEDADGLVITEATKIPTGAKPLAGIEFTVTKMTDDSKTIETAVEDTSNPVEQSLTTDEHGIAMFTGLPIGVYKVEEKEDKNGLITDPIAPFLVSVPITDPIDGSEWVYDVHVYPKNELLKMDMFVEEDTNKHQPVYVSQEHQWLITTSVPTNIAAAEKYEVVSGLSSALNYKGDVVVEAIAEGGITETLTAGVDYTVTPPTGPSGGTVKVELTEKGRTKLTNIGITKAVNAAKELKISYTTVVNESIKDNDTLLGKAISSTATLNYTNSFGQDKQIALEENQRPEIHTGGVVIDKYDSDDNNIKLENAEFAIATSEANALAGRYLKKTVDGVVLDWDSTASADNTAYNAAPNWIETSDADGRATFSGLRYGITGNLPTEGETKYWIVETKAPKDENGKSYNLMAAPQEVTVNSTSHSAASKVEIPNNKAFTLPKTGGMGTILFTVTGVLLIAAAAFLLLRYKKEEKKS